MIRVDRCLLEDRSEDVLQNQLHDMVFHQIMISYLRQMTHQHGIKRIASVRKRRARA